MFHPDSKANVKSWPEAKAEQMVNITINKIVIVLFIVILFFVGGNPVGSAPWVIDSKNLIPDIFYVNLVDNSS